MLSIIGVMVLLLVGRILLDSGSEAPAQTDTTTTSTAPAESNEQRLARYVADARAKLNAGDYQGAIDAAQKALIVNQDSLEAIEVKTKAEEAARAAAAGTPPTPEASATQATPPAATGTQAQPPTPPAPPPSTTSSRQAPAASQGASTASTQPARRRRSEPSEKKGRAERGPSPEVQQAYTRAKAALDRGRYAEAVAGFEEVVKAEPGYQDAAALLAQARTGLKAQAAEAVRSGNQLAASGDIAGAREQYRRAQSMDPSAPGLSQAMASLTEQMREAGRQAYRRARQYDALGRASDAIPLYEQAVQYLPDSDPNRKVAQDRLTALRPR
jgi:tetratricopeptide (TPR) repeat protein